MILIWSGAFNLFLLVIVFQGFGLNTFFNEYQFLIFIDISILFLVYVFIFKVFSSFYDSKKEMEKADKNEGKVNIYMQNVSRYEAGELENLICPRCLAETVSIKFGTKSEQNRRSVLFICSLCNKYDTAQYKLEPPFFNLKRVVK